MAKLSDDEQKLLDELNERANAPDEDDYEIEIYDTAKGRGARIPVSKGKSWLYDNFGIGEPSAEPKAPKGKQEGRDGEEPKNVAVGYFGRKAASE